MAHNRIECPPVYIYIDYHFTVHAYEVPAATYLEMVVRNVKLENELGQITWKVKQVLCIINYRYLSGDLLFYVTLNFILELLISAYLNFSILLSMIMKYKLLCT